MSVGERLRNWRKEKNLTTIQIHNATGISLGALSNYETDKREINSELLIQLYETFNIDIVYILTGVKDKKILTEEQEQLISSFDSCDQETKEDIIRFVKRCAVTQNGNESTPLRVAEKASTYSTEK